MLRSYLPVVVFAGLGLIVGAALVSVNSLLGPRRPSREQSLPLLAEGKPPERRDITIETAFPGPGARDVFELVTRAVTGPAWVAG